MKIPKEAMPVVRVLRRDVPRPKKMPVGGSWCKRDRFYCPMGLHPESDVPAPSDYVCFAGGCCSQKAVDAFFMWWDGLENDEYAAAVDVVWPVKGSGEIGNLRERKVSRK